MESENKMTEKDLYEQGSKLCQQYSQLTMQIRTLASNLLIVYTVTICITLNNAQDKNFSMMLIIGGGVLFLFSLVLAILNFHYSSAFNKIRDESLVPLESSFTGTKGPWKAHMNVRETKKLTTYMAWYGPFFVLCLIGLTSLVYGIYNRVCS